ncbi:MAG: protein adenylyltransferase SelO family protein, partial [Spartobacteria bacterium]
FPKKFHQYWLSGMRAKLGLFTEEAEDLGLIESLLQAMHRNRSDYTQTLRALDPVEASPADPAWHSDWTARLGRQGQTFEEVREQMRRHNPAVIPRNHKVEEALDAASSQGDLAPLHRLLAALANPFEDGPEKNGYREASADGSVGYQTFCGT